MAKLEFEGESTKPCLVSHPLFAAEILFDDEDHQNNEQNQATNKDSKIESVSDHPSVLCWKHRLLNVQ